MSQLLEVLLLGPPEIRWNGRPLTISRRIPRILLFYLASLGKQTSRNEILNLFWGEETEEVARLRLRETLNKLRKALPSPELLRSRGDLVELDFDQTYVDVLAFDELVAGLGSMPWKIPLEKTLPDHIYTTLKTTLELWHGDKFLSGAWFAQTVALDNWLMHTSQRLETMRNRILERLADHETASGNLDAALRFSQMALVNNELEEGIHERILRLLILMGRTSQARQHYQQLESRLLKEWGVAPGPELMALAGQIREPARNLPVQPQATWHIHPAPAVPFVGRLQLLGQLRALFFRGGGAFLLGESGQGKSRLLQEFSSQVLPAPRLMLAHCREAESNLPLQPIVDVLRQSISEQEWRQLPPAWANQLLRLFPELAILLKEVTQPLQVGLEQARALLLEAIRQVFLLACRSQRLLLVLDDAHWADEYTLAAAAYLLERPPFIQSAFLAVAARPEVTNPYLEDLIRSPKKSTRVQVLNLTDLEPDEIAELTWQFTGKSPSSRFTQQLAQETGGNPLFILETLQVLTETQPDLDLSGPTQLPLPESFYNLILDRMKSLSSLARSVMEMSAIYGSEFNVRVLARACENDYSQIAQALEELSEHGLVELSEDHLPDVYYQFVHDKFREVQLMEINPLRAQVLHGKAAEALEAEEGTDQGSLAAVLAGHYQAAGESLPAFHYWIQAGQHARRLFAFPEASQAFMWAEELIDRCGEALTDVYIYSLYKNWGDMALATSDTSTLQRISTNLQRLSEGRKSTFLKGLSLEWQANACLTTNQFEQGLDRSGQAIEFLEKANHPYSLSVAYTNHGLFLYMLGRVHEALQDFRIALNLVGEGTEPLILRQRGQIHYQLGMACLLNGELITGHGHAVQSLDDYARVKDANGLISAYNLLVLADYYMGDFSKSLEHSLRGIELARQAQAWPFLCSLLSQRAMVKHALGDLDGMWEDAEQGISIGEKLGRMEVTSLGYRVIADAWNSLGDYPLAIANYQHAIRISPNSLLEMDYSYRLGIALVLSGQVEKGFANIKQSIERTRSTGVLNAALNATVCLALCQLLTGDLENARETILSVQETAHQKGFAMLDSYAQFILGEIALHKGDTAAALEILQDPPKYPGQSPYFWTEFRREVLLCIALEKAGKPENEACQRVSQMLDHLTAHARKDLFQFALRNFKDRVTQSMESFIP